MAFREGTGIGMRYQNLVWSICTTLNILIYIEGNTLEVRPWLDPLLEFYFCPTYNYNYFKRVDGADPHHSYPSSNQVISIDGRVSPMTHWDVQVEVEGTHTPRQSWGYRSAAIQGRFQWGDDIAGDPISGTLGLHVREVSSHSLADISSPYHATLNFELHSAIGKEWSQEGVWTLRTWGMVGAGMGNRGFPWIRAIGGVEKSWNHRHRLGAFGIGYIGLGNKQHIHVEHFHGWGQFQHQSVDIGFTYQYHFDIYGDLSLTYSTRIYAHVFPEFVQSVTLAYQFPFSVL